MAYLYNSSSLRLPPRTSPYTASKATSPTQRASARLLNLNLGPSGANAPKVAPMQFNFPQGQFGTGGLFNMLSAGGMTPAVSAGGMPDYGTDWQSQQGATNLPPRPNGGRTYNPETYVPPQPPRDQDPRTDDGNGNTNTNQNTGPNWGAIMSLLQSQYRSSMQAAQAQALAKKKEILLGFGSKELARKVLSGVGPGSGFGNYGAYSPDMSGNGLFAFSYNGGIPEQNPGGSWTVVATRPDGTVSAQAMGGERNGETITFNASGFAPQQTNAAAALGSADPFFDLISDDPDKSTSTMAQLNRLYRDRTKETNEELNAGNLWYSGARGVALNQLNRSKLEDTENATREVQAQFSDIDSQIAAAEQQWQQRIFDLMMQQAMAQ